MYFVTGKLFDLWTDNLLLEKWRNRWVGNSGANGRIQWHLTGLKKWIYTTQEESGLAVGKSIDYLWRQSAAYKIKGSFRINFVVE